MQLGNGKRAILRKFNRDDNSNYYDDQNYEDISIKIIPFKVEDVIKFGLSTCPEATGYFQIDRRIDVIEGDQILFKNSTYTILKLSDIWLFGRVENKIAYVK